jgi:predicted secreted protein
MLKKTILLLPLLLLMAAQAHAAAHDGYNRVGLSASASMEVENDTLVAVLYTQKEGSNTSKLSKAVNRSITEAVEMAKKLPNIKVQTLEYSTNPVYKRNILNGWRVRQSIRLESKDSTALSDLIGTLQKKLKVSHISYSISPERRKEVEEQLIAKAIAAFNHRAELVAKAMDRNGFRLIQIQVNTSGMAPRPYPMRAMAMEAKIADAGPALEGGTQRVTVSVNGSVELKL